MAANESSDLGAGADLSVAPVPPPNPFIVRVESPRKGQIWRLVCLSRAVTGVETHWNGLRTVPCTLPKSHCLGCRAGQPVRWRGFLTCYEPVSKQCFFSPLTAKAYHDLEARLAGITDLRGILFTVSRSKGGNNGRLLYELVGAHPKPELLPGDVDPLPTLRKMWGLLGATIDFNGGEV
jgi:hypothetical protein